jgi:hypothetical protein
MMSMEPRIYKGCILLVEPEEVLNVAYFKSMPRHMSAKSRRFKR